MKKIFVLIIAMIIIAGTAIVYSEMSEALKEDRKYEQVTEQVRAEPDYNWKRTFTDYGEIKVCWNQSYMKNGLETFEVHKDGFTYFWSKEAIAEYVSNSQQTKYFDGD